MAGQNQPPRRAGTKSMALGIIGLVLIVAAAGCGLAGLLVGVGEGRKATADWAKQLWEQIRDDAEGNPGRAPQVRKESLATSTLLFIVGGVALVCGVVATVLGFRRQAPGPVPTSQPPPAP